jgi:hypothetical protein
LRWESNTSKVIKVKITCNAFVDIVVIPKFKLRMNSTNTNDLIMFNHLLFIPFYSVELKQIDNAHIQGPDKLSELHIFHYSKSFVLTIINKQ